MFGASPLIASLRGDVRRPQRRIDTREKRQLDRILQQARETVDALGFPQADAGGLARAAVRASRRSGVPASVLMSVTGQESAFGTNLGPSSAGALGETQFIPGTRDQVLAQYGVDAYGGPAQALEAAGLYLRDLGFNEDPQGALNSYSGGGGAAYIDPVLDRAQQFGFLDRAAGGKLKVPAGRTTGPEPPRPRAVQRFIANPNDKNFGDLNPILQRRAVQLGRRSGEPVSLTSGLRTFQEQAELFRNRGSNPFPVAPPGSSRHETGLAFDADLTAGQRQLLPRLGLGTPVPNDPVHVELVGRAAQRAQGIPSVGGVSLPSSGGFTGVGGGREAPAVSSSRRAFPLLGAINRLNRVNRVGGADEEDEEELPPADQLLTVANLQAAFRPRRRLPKRF